MSAIPRPSHSSLVRGSEYVVRERAQELLAPYHDPLDRIPRRAWNLFQTRFLHLKQTWQKRSRDSLIYDLMCGEMRELFYEHESIRVIDIAKKEQVLLTIHDAKRVPALNVRFKKFNAEMRPRNIPTQRARDMEAQRLILECAAVPLVTVGYRLDEYETRIAETWVQMRQGPLKVLWEYRLDEAIAGVARQLVLPATQKTTSSSRVGPKLGTKKPDDGTNS